MIWSLRTTLPRGTGGEWERRRAWGKGKVALGLMRGAFWETESGRGGGSRRVRMLASAERPAERGGEGGDLSPREAGAGTRAEAGDSRIQAARRDPERGAEV